MQDNSAKSVYKFSFQQSALSLISEMFEAVQIWKQALSFREWICNS